MKDVSKKSNAACRSSAPRSRKSRFLLSGCLSPPHAAAGSARAARGAAGDHRGCSRRRAVQDVRPRSLLRPQGAGPACVRGDRGAADPELLPARIALDGRYLLAAFLVLSARCPRSSRPTGGSPAARSRSRTPASCSIGRARRCGARAWRAGVLLAAALLAAAGARHTYRPPAGVCGADHGLLQPQSRPWRHLRKPQLHGASRGDRRSAADRDDADRAPDASPHGHSASSQRWSCRLASLLYANARRAWLALLGRPLR